MSFQLTAARRRLHRVLKLPGLPVISFNSQPPEGGCIRRLFFGAVAAGFNSQPPEGGCAIVEGVAVFVLGFNSQPPEGGC